MKIKLINIWGIFVLIFVLIFLLTRKPITDYKIDPNLDRSLMAGRVESFSNERGLVTIRFLDTNLTCSFFPAERKEENQLIFPTSYIKYNDSFYKTAYADSIFIIRDSIIKAWKIFKN